MSLFSEPTYYFFLFKLFFNFLLGGVIITSVFIKLFDHILIKINDKLLLLFGIGLAPYLTSILLYYLLWLIPNQKDLFYLGSVCIIYLGLAYLSWAEIKGLWDSVFIGLKKLKRLYLVMLSAFAILFFIGWSFYIDIKSITEHDELEYAVQGKVFHESKKIEYSDFNYDEESGFYYVGLHGYSFPLIASWERIQNSILNVKSDLLFRSINSLYGILIILTLALIGYLYIDKHLAIVILFALPLTYGFFETLVKYHIDFYRIFFVNLSVLCLYQAIKNPSISIAVLLGILFGAQANAHTLGALLFIIQLGVFFFFIPYNLIKKLKLTSIVLLFALVFGAIHYIVDVIWGTGWIFQEIKFY